MIAFDKEHLSNTLEAIKLSQESLKQLMTLSAGSLALYFSFIAKQTVGSPNIFGALVVGCWAMSLICAAISQYNLSSIYSSLSTHYDAHRAIQPIIDAPLPSSDNPWPNEKVEAFQAELANAKEWFQESTKRFGRDFFPVQERQLRCMRASLVLLVAGFVILVVQFVFTQLST